jgi:hypothetical protein
MLLKGDTTSHALVLRRPIERLLQPIGHQIGESHENLQFVDTVDTSCCAIRLHASC